MNRSWLKILPPAAVFGLLLILLLWPPPANQWDWDAYNGFGLAGFLLLLLSSVAAPASAASYSARALRLHIVLMTLAVLAIAAHAVALLVSNDVLVEYLKWRAPYYMHAGTLALVVLLVVSLSSTSRVRRVLHQNFHSFRLWHRALGAVAVLLAAWHIVGSEYLVRGTWRVLLFSVLVSLLLIWCWYPLRQRWPSITIQTRIWIWGLGASALVLLITGAYLLSLVR